MRLVYFLYQKKFWSLEGKKEKKTQRIDKKSFSLNIASMIIKMTHGLNKLHFLQTKASYNDIHIFHTTCNFFNFRPRKTISLFAKKNHERLLSPLTKDTLYSTIKSKRHNIKFYDCLRYYVETTGISLSSPFQLLVWTKQLTISNTVAT